MRIALCNVNGRFYAIDDVCTHDGGPLDQGVLEDNLVECPRHGAKFDVETGRAVVLPAVRPVQHVRGAGRRRRREGERGLMTTSRELHSPPGLSRLPRGIATSAPRRNGWPRRSRPSNSPRRQRRRLDDARSSSSISPTSEANVVTLLGAIARGEAPDMSFFNDLDANNARTLAECSGRPMDAVRDELAAVGASCSCARAAWRRRRITQPDRHAVPARPTGRRLRRP